MEVVTVPKEVDPIEKETLEEAMFHFFIEASLTEVGDDIVKIDPWTRPVPPRLVSDVDKQLIDVAQSDTIDVDKLKCLEEIYGAPVFVSIQVMIERLEQRNIMMLTEELNRVTKLFNRLEKRLMRQD